MGLLAYKQEKLCAGVKKILICGVVLFTCVCVCVGTQVSREVCGNDSHPETVEQFVMVL